MNKIKLLDCTLRDGGYINNWEFGFTVIQDIIRHLEASGVEYIECGYISEENGGNSDSTQYKDFKALRNVIKSNGRKNRYTVMINYGEVPVEHIPEASEASFLTIRVCFHKKDKEKALEYCSVLKEKGYEVFVQPMAALNYTDAEFVDLIRAVNKLKPACFYIVDSFGVIEIEDFQRILSISDKNLGEGIILGYHGHNNLQQAYGNAKYMVEQNLNHNIILDASVYGMGRGAGNLNMELFASYLNRHYHKEYNIDCFLDIMDEHLKPIFAEHYWGYSLPFYLSAQYNCHPNYAGYFADKNTLTNKSMKQLLASLPADAKNYYSTELAEKYYQAFQKNYVDDTSTLQTLQMAFEGKQTLILAPGRSLKDRSELITEYIQEWNPMVIAINVIPMQFRCDYLFCANEKRLRDLELPNSCNLIVSSNIRNAEDAIKINYSSYLGNEDLIADNPTLMVMRLLLKIGKRDITVAGFDGYGSSAEDNYFEPRLALGTSIGVKMRKNELIIKELKVLREKIAIRFLTPSKYDV